MISASDRKLLPPMTALRAFEAAARLGSFTLAADELFVTQGAVSRQIRLLEDLLNVRLFERAQQRVKLTAAGEYYAHQIAETLGHLKSAAAQTIAFSKPGSQLHLAIVPTFASRWIIPRLRAFTTLYPRLQLRLSSIQGGAAPDLEAYDAALVVGRANQPNSVWRRLESEDLIAVAAPRWMRRHGVRSAADLIDAPLLRHTGRADLWSRWFALNGIDANALAPATLAFDQVTMIIEAAVAELGAALLPRALIARELERRELAVIKSEPLFVSDGFHLVYAAHKKNYPPLAAFQSWLLGAE